MIPEECSEAGRVGRTLGSDLVRELSTEPRAGTCQEEMAEVFNLKLPSELDSPGHCGQKVHLDPTGTVSSVEGVNPLLKPKYYAPEDTSM